MIDPSALPDEILRGELYELADTVLTAAGYTRIGFDHYATPENGLSAAATKRRIRRNFQGFTDDPASAIIGFGVSAIGFVDDLYAQNHKSMSAYVAAVGENRLPVARGLTRTEQESVVATAISDLLCSMETDISRILRTAPPNEAVRICAALERMEADGIVHWRGDRIAIADGAHILSRAVAAALDPYARPARDYAMAV